MVEQSGEPPGAAEVGAELISLMLPDIELEVVWLMLSRTASDAATGRAGHEGHRGNESQTALLQQYLGLLTVIRDVGIDRAQLVAILGLDPDTLPADDGSRRPPMP